MRWNLYYDKNLMLDIEINIFQLLIIEVEFDQRCYIGFKHILNMIIINEGTANLNGM
jgi:hypothetical protein